jgi:(1->4)-alpha-D-glucan 1-alpha-D-glucosylmutase
MKRITSFYRQQFGGAAGFEAVAGRVAYLADLGISHLYASPVFEARSGSTHGYDITDPNRFRKELGGEEGFRVLSKALDRYGIGLMLDIVPNHMAASEENVYLADILANGPESQSARIFDIDWGAGEGRLTLPILGRPLEECINACELSVDDGRLRYFDRQFPLRSGTEDLPLAELVKAQHYRLAYWRDLDLLNYRRFFDITDLIGVRQEDDEVFEETHRLIRSLVEQGTVHALRVDHIDGLREPGAYLERLAAFFPDNTEPPIYVEKILEGDETLPPEWHCRGETGYWALGRIDRFFMNAGSKDAFDADGDDLHAVIMQAKDDVIAQSFAHEFDKLSADLGVVGASDLKTLAKTFHVYRTYMGPRETDAVNQRERSRLDGYAEKAEMPVPLGALGDPAADACLRFQQMTGPVMAKSLEDTAFYRYISHLALNEVGADPAQYSLQADDFHKAVLQRARTEPLAMNTTSTHDTKRSEDARARLLALTWGDEGAFRTLHELRTRWHQPSRRSGWHLVQAALAVWPDGDTSSAHLAERLASYLVKAEREAKRETSWTDPDDGYENALRSAAADFVSRESDAIRSLLARTRAAYETVVLARTVLKLTLPGIPDTYNGTETEYLKLVDPDNRGAVIGSSLPEEGTFDRRKFDLTRSLLRLRRAHPALFLEGDYTPIETPRDTLGFKRGSGPVLHVGIRRRPSASLAGIPGDCIHESAGGRVTLET